MNDLAPPGLAALAEAAPAAETDRLTVIREKVARVRDLRALVEDLGARVKAANIEINELTFTTLPDLFLEAGTDSLGLDANGNLPAYDAKMKPYFKANIEADWPADQRNRGFALLTQRGAADLIKNTIVVELGRGENDTAEAICKFLGEGGIPFTQGRAVNWNTLTAWLREQVTKYKQIFTPGELDAIGGKVGRVVEVKPRRV